MRLLLLLFALALLAPDGSCASSEQAANANEASTTASAGTSDAALTTSNGINNPTATPALTTGARTTTRPRGPSEFHADSYTDEKLQCDAGYVRISLNHCLPSNSKNTIAMKKADSNQKQKKLCCVAEPTLCTNIADGIAGDHSDIKDKANNWPMSCKPDAEEKCKEAGGVCSEKVCCKKKAEDELCNATEPVYGTPVKPDGTSCQSNGQCVGSDIRTWKLECLRVQNSTDTKYCCGSKLQCHGGWSPIATEAGLYERKCDLSSTYKKEELCCPLPVSTISPIVNVSWISAQLDNGDPKQCKTNDDCGEAGFCGEGVALYDDKKKQLKTVDAATKFCFPDPKCGIDGKGRPVRGENGTGLKTCSTGCSSGYCDPLTNLCCEQTCPPQTDDFFLDSAPKENMTTSSCAGAKTCTQDLLTKDAFENKCIKDEGICCLYARKNASHSSLNCTRGSMAEMKPFVNSNKTELIECDPTKTINATAFPNTFCTKLDNVKQKGYMCTNQTCNGIPLMWIDEATCKTDADCGNTTTADGGSELSGTCEAYPADTQKHCCPKVDKGIPNYHYDSARTCRVAKECNSTSVYCKKDKQGANGKCSFYGTSSRNSDQSKEFLCNENDECPASITKMYPGRDLICVYYAEKSGKTVCQLPPQTKLIKDTTELNKVYLGLAIAGVVGFVVFGLLAGLSLLKYRSRHLFDKKKSHKKDGKSKKEKDDKSAKTDKTDDDKKEKSEIGSVQK